MKNIWIIICLLCISVVVLSSVIFFGIAQNRPVPEQNLLKAVNDQDNSYVQKILNKKFIFNRKTIDKAILIAAQKNNINLVKLLEPYAGRNAHREAYRILQVINQNSPELLEQLYESDV